MPEEGRRGNWLSGGESGSKEKALKLCCGRERTGCGKKQMNIHILYSTACQV